ncbi:MAG TPA: hypothetical protein IAD08_03615 [Candidatus Scatovivens faecipullorum]|nr:hypothetical protein [Candidatus Scatovivens faecipullorum]
MSQDVLVYLMVGVGGLFAILVLAYYLLSKKMQTKETRYVAQLVQGTKRSSFNMDVFYQKFYIKCAGLPFLRRYALKLRRRLEIINLEDEFITRKQVAKIMFKALLVVIPLTFVVIYMTYGNMLLMCSLLLFELFFLETLLEGMVDSIDNKLLREQLDFFSEIRHAYHEYNMVEEAIYEVSQDDEKEVSRQAEKIYEVLISDDPETELEKYYDIAPNSYLKEFAGVSYLTKEFGDRKDKDGASLYLKNLNNITQEMQIEILKRDKLDYVFQSLSMIAALPILFIDTVKNWAIGQFSFTRQFYNGTSGFLVQVLLIVVTFLSYMLTRKLKDNGSVNTAKNMENPWQAKLYKNKYAKKFIDLFIPKQGTKDYRKIVQLLKDSASKLKMEWLYINRLGAAIIALVGSLIVLFTAHKMAIDFQFTEPTADYNLLGSMSEQQEKKAMETTEKDNVFLYKYQYDYEVTQEILAKDVAESEEYGMSTEEELETIVERIWEKLQIVQSEYIKWFEILIALVIMVVGYEIPVGLLIFQKIMRKMDMENEVMQFQTIILMLMKIERVNVEMILEWLERYANIFKEPISKCVNNYESGPWEALEELKNDISFQQLIRIVESLQAAVEQIPIREAFDELDTERAYHQEKRKESNERMISKKSMIGKVIGFAPMVMLFVVYLIIPMCLIGMTSMTSAFETMSSMA